MSVTPQAAPTPASTNWVPLSGTSGVPQPVVDGQWIKGVGGAAVWSAITTADITDRGTANGVATLGSTGQVTAGQRSTASATPPGSPIDGDEWILPADTTAGIMWRFRYRAASASAYKWEFIGGPWQTTIVATSEGALATAAWHDLTTPGPQITVARAGEYLVSASASIQSAIAAASLYIGVVLGASSTNPGTAQGGMTISTANFLGTLAISPQTYLAVTAGGLLKVRYFTTAGGAGQNWSARNLAVLPIRVS